METLVLMLDEFREFLKADRAKYAAKVKRIDVRLD